MLNNWKQSFVHNGTHVIPENSNDLIWKLSKHGHVAKINLYQNKIYGKDCDDAWSIMIENILNGLAKNNAVTTQKVNSRIFFNEFCENVCWMLFCWRELLCAIYVCVTGPKQLTHWGRDKMVAISQTTLSNAFLWMKMLEFWLKFHWSLCLRVQLTIFQHWFR